MAQYFLEKYSKELGKDIKKISQYALKALLDYSFPGNVRELENIIERGVALEASNIILPESLTLSLAKKDQMMIPEPDIPSQGLNLEEAMEKVEKGLLLSALKKSRGVKKRAAQLLRISFRSMLYRLEKYGIEKKGSDHEG